MSKTTWMGWAIAALVVIATWQNAGRTAAEIELCVQTGGTEIVGIDDRTCVGGVNNYNVNE